ncbi:UNVERIFIED_CONTAM: hypothetical protein HDU68_004632, partial [Siphonaria sp. JEL0065]
MALVVSDTKASVGAVFTKNAFAAAPVIVGREILANDPTAHAVLINAGCANACTGEVGLRDTRASIAAMDKALGYSGKTPSTFMLSTGVIGVPLKMDKILKGVDVLCKNLKSDHESWVSVAKGIMTTDTFPKLRSKEFVGRDGKTYRMAGWAKGA